MSFWQKIRFSFSSFKIRPIKSRKAEARPVKLPLAGFNKTRRFNRVHPVKSDKVGISPKAKLFNRVKKGSAKFQWTISELTKKNIKGIKRLLTLTGWRQFLKVLARKEKIVFFISLSLVLVSLVFLSVNFYFKNTKIVPAKGGIHIEGVIGQPRFINPVYNNSDVDRDLVQLIFSGLMKYNENLELVPDLAEKYEIEDEGKVYKFYLKENILWQDKNPLTADDIIFTIKTIQNPDFKSPLQANWVGVEIEKIDNLIIKFKLKKSYSAFLENCTLKILPKHIWQEVSPENFPLQTYNLKPIGSGLYKLKEIKQNKPPAFGEKVGDKSQSIKSLTLVQNPLYFGNQSPAAQKPNISEIEFIFFDDEKELIKAARLGKIKGLSSNSLSPFLQENWQQYLLSLPRYFAVFFNKEKSKVLAEKEIRLALNYGTNKKILGAPASKRVAHSPILPEFYGFNLPSKIYEFNIDKAKNILEEAGFKDENQDGLREKIIKKEPVFQFKSKLQIGSQGKEVQELQKCLAKFPEIYPEGEATGYFGSKTKEAVIRFQEEYAKEILEPWGFKKGTGIVSKTTRAKLNKVCFEEPEEILPLKFSLVTVDQPQLVEVANLLKEQWKLLGAEIEIKKFPLSQLEQDFIKTRNYECLLFGEVLGAIPDPLPFWHSSQKKDPGLNLALYENKEADKLLEENRKLSDPKARAEKMALFQDILIEDVPCLFLYSPDFIYLISKEIKGAGVKKIIDPSKRFVGIENWYIKTKRTWK